VQLEALPVLTATFLSRGLRDLHPIAHDPPIRPDGSLTMSAFLINVPLVFAQEGLGNTWLPIYILGFFLLIYFMILRPQKQQDQKRRAMIDAMKKNDKVLTTGGIYGTVISVDTSQDRVVLRVDDEKGVKVSFTRSSVARVIEAKAEKEPEL
jgi:preprotein translocase subunit YajC